jgi:hypothetical protein
MIAWRTNTAVVLLIVATAACSDDKASTPEQPAVTVSTAPPTVCATTPATEGRIVRVTIDDLVDGFGSLGLQADSGLTPGIVRVEVTGDAANAMPLGVSILRDGFPVGVVDGVGAGETCGLDLEVSEGTYHITDGERDVEFTVGP